MNRRSFMLFFFIVGGTAVVVVVPPTHRLVLNQIGRSRGYGGCIRCGDTWDWKPSHTTYFPDGSGGMFPLCEECWTELGTAAARQPFYKKQFEEWAFQILRELPPDRHADAWKDHFSKMNQYEEALRLEEK